MIFIKNKSKILKTNFNSLGNYFLILTLKCIKNIYDSFKNYI